MADFDYESVMLRARHDGRGFVEACLAMGWHPTKYTKLPHGPVPYERQRDSNGPSETWAQHPQFKTYWISNLGRVMIGERAGSWRGRVLAGRVNEGGYRRIGLYENGKRYDRYVHVLVLESHIGPRPGPSKFYQACHAENNNPADCRLANLRWDTACQNYQDQVEHGTAAVGERHGRSQLSNLQRAKVLRSHEHRSVLAKRYGVTENTICKLRARNR